MGGCRWKRGEKQRSRQGTVHQSHRSQGLDGDRETQGLWDPLESEVPPGPDPNLGWHSQVQGFLQVAQFPFDFHSGPLAFWTIGTLSFWPLQRNCSPLISFF